MSNRGKRNISNVKHNQNDRKRYDFYWTDKEIDLLLEKFYFPRFLLPFHVVHILRFVFQNRFASRFLSEAKMFHCVTYNVSSL